MAHRENLKPEETAFPLAVTNFSDKEGVIIVIVFLTSTIKHETSHNQICMAKSYLSSVINQKAFFGNIPTVQVSDQIECLSFNYLCNT